MSEEWRLVPGFGGLYEASSAGRVRSHHTFLGRKLRGGPKILRSVVRRGRPDITMCWPGAKPKRVQVGTLVLMAFVGPRPDGMECCHGNDDPLDNRLENLRWDTRAANCADAVKNGRNHGRIGERHRCAKLTKADVLSIRASAGKVSRRELAERFGVRRQTIASIILGRSWVQAVTIPQPSESSS